VVDGVAIRQGWLNTAPNGFFDVTAGPPVGGHATATVWYSFSQNLLGKRNSWVHWGARTDNPEFNSSDPALGGNADGFSNVGFCRLDHYLDMYVTDQQLQSGETDAFVVSGLPQGFDVPAIRPISVVDLLGV
jgi:hypothetical protein